MLAGDHPHPFPGWRQRVLDSVYEVSSPSSPRTHHANSDDALEMEVCNREQIEADFLAGEGCCKSILETSIQIKGMKTFGSLIIVGNTIRVCFRSEKQ